MISADVVANFIKLKNEIQEWSDDNPAHVFDLARTDKIFLGKASSLSSLANNLLSSHRHAPGGIIAPVSEVFIREWRDYEERYAPAISQVGFTRTVLRLNEMMSEATEDIAPITWEEADKRAAVLFSEKEEWTKWDSWAGKCDAALKAFMSEGTDAILNFCDEEEDMALFDMAIEGSFSWVSLRDYEFDIRGFLRRNRIAPLLLVPHAIDSNVSGEQIDLYKLWTETRKAFIDGSFLACVALSRAILEKLLRRFYKVSGETLPALIRDCERLFSSKNFSRELHSIRLLANVIMHSRIAEEDGATILSLPPDMSLFSDPPGPEHSALKALRALRTLIEEVPRSNSRKMKR